MKRVLVLWWSQSGQLEGCMRAFCEPLEASGVELVYRRVEPAVAYPFPWSVSAFFGQFPETFLEEGVDIDFEPPEGDFDLVIVASQVWFLKPSPPFCRLLSRHPALFAGRRVLTLVACRNMWIRGWGRLAERIREAGGDITDRVVAVHSGSVLASYFTTLAWMLTGKRDALKPLGKAEIAAQTVERVRGLGERFASGEHVDEAPISLTHALGEQLVGRTFFPLLAAIGHLTPRQGILRTLFAWFQMSFTISAVLTLLGPCMLVRLLFGRWVDPWLREQARL
ncbi:MAG TPA: hypothetical protein QGF58_24745 [Myxococcota bacterium]|nr:hypothetical protein [Myxococcota bacterium]